MAEPDGEVAPAVETALAALDAFRHAAPAARAAAIAAATIEAVPAGAVLYREGDAPSDLAVVASGRLRARRRSGADTATNDTVLGDIAPGEIVGERALITGETRTADIIAVRNSVVVRLPADILFMLMASSPEAMRAVVRESLRRSQATGAERNHIVGRPAVIGVLAPSANLGPAAAADIVAGAVRAAGGHALGIEHRAGLPIDEQRDVIVVVQPDHDDPTSIRSVVGQADLVLVVAPSTGWPLDAAVITEALAERRRHGAPAPWEVVLVHPREVVTGSAARCAPLGPSAIRHLRVNHETDRARLGRRLLGTSVGLVISGGGARAFAALGAQRVLRERGIPIDYVGGSSIGALMSVLIATGDAPDVLIPNARKVLQQADWGRDFTLPALSLLSIRNAVPAIDTLFGKLDLADTPIPCFVTTVDLSACSLVVHDRGPAAKWVRASASPPGLWPPVIAEDGHVHVDGGVLDNLPIDAMRERGVSSVVAVNVSLTPEFRLPPGTTEARSWVDLVRRRRAGAFYPSVVDLLFRMGIVGSLPAQRRSADLADLVIRPDVGHHGLADYAAVDSIVEAGARAAADALSALDSSTDVSPFAAPTLASAGGAA